MNCRQKKKRCGKTTVALDQTIFLGILEKQDSPSGFQVTSSFEVEIFLLSSTALKMTQNPVSPNFTI